MNKSPVVSASCFMAALLASCTSNAPSGKIREFKDKLYFNDSVLYEDEKRIRPAIIAECKIGKNVVEGIRLRSQKNGLPLSNEHQDRKFVVEIENATPGIFVFGNFGSVPATLDIKYRVTSGDKVLLEESRHCETNLAGVLGLQPSACNKLERCARNLGAALSERISRVLYP